MANKQRKVFKKEPTARQKRAAILVSENLRKDKPEPIGKLLQEAGYSVPISKTPSQVTRSQGFIDLLDSMGVTDDLLAKSLSEGLSATKATVMGTRSDESFVDVQPDYAVRHKYLETGLRLKGYGKSDPSFNFNFNVRSDEQRQAYDL